MLLIDFPLKLEQRGRFVDRDSLNVVTWICEDQTTEDRINKVYVDEFVRLKCHFSLLQLETNFSSLSYRFW